MNLDMKEKLRKKCFCTTNKILMIEKILKSKAINVVKAINSRQVVVKSLY